MIDVDVSLRSLLTILSMMAALMASASGVDRLEKVIGDPVGDMACHQVEVEKPACCCDEHVPEETDNCGCYAGGDQLPEKVAVASATGPTLVVLDTGERVEICSDEVDDLGRRATILPPNRGPPKPPELGSRALRAPPLG